MNIDQTVPDLKTTVNEVTNVNEWSLVELFVAHIILAIVVAYGSKVRINLVKDFPYGKHLKLILEYKS